TGIFGACAWVTLEWVRGWLFSGFGWNGLGVALHGDLPMIQIAEFTGVAGLSFLVAFSNLMVVIIVRRIAGEIGPVFLKRIRWEFSVHVAAIQPNIPQSEKFDPQSEEKIFQQLDTLTTLAAASRPQLLLWPEAATPQGMFADEVNYRFVLNQARRGDFAMLIGTLDSDIQRHEDYNVATLLTDRGQHMQTYRKMHLVPFG